jgi:hypothetical protein
MSVSPARSARGAVAGAVTVSAPRRHFCTQHFFRHHVTDLSRNCAIRTIRSTKLARTGLDVRLTPRETGFLESRAPHAMASFA